MRISSLYKLISLTLFCFSLTVTFGNNGSKDSLKDNGKLHWGFYCSIKNCYRIIDSYDKSNIDVKRYIDSLNSDEVPSIGSLFGLLLRKKMFDRIYIETGLLLNYHSYKTIVKYDSFPPNEAYYREYSFSYLSIPMFANYILFPHRTTFYTAGFGLITNKRIGTNVNFIGNGGSGGYNEPYSPTMLMDGNIKLGFSYGSKFSFLNLSLYFDYSLNGIKQYISSIKYKSYRVHFYSYGFGINYSF